MDEAELLRWLDVIPGRNWLLLGEDTATLAELVRAHYAPSSITQLRDSVDLSSIDSGRFDVAIGQTHAADLSALRRVVWPGGTVALLTPAAGLEAAARQAGLHAVQAKGGAVRGTR